VTADLGTRSGLYASVDEVLLSSASSLVRAAACEQASEVQPQEDAGDPFADSRARFEGLVEQLAAEGTAALEHGELEELVQEQGRELLRVLYQDHLDLRAKREERLQQVVDAAGGVRRAVEAGHERLLRSVFGQVRVERLAYRQRAEANLYPADGVLNLPCERHSHGLRKLAALEAARGSYADAVEAIGRATGTPLGKRQVEELAGRAALDVEAFYASRAAEAAEEGDLLVLSADGKGIVMRPEALRAQTARAAQRSSRKLKTRLSKGEKRNRKRLAEVGAVYDLTPVARSPEEVLAASEDKAAPAPKAKSKWLTASVVEDAASVVSRVFEEAERRDPAHERTWVALVDGNSHQIDRIRAEAKERNVTVTIVVDFIHVLEYLWDAAWCFHREGDPEAEQWVAEKALAILKGKAASVAAAIRRKATRLGLDAKERASADRCADYLRNKRPYLDYRSALAKGFPIATGVIEGACRHLVKDRMDLTGARWGLQGAEAILKLRALRANGDFDEYWRYHLAQERGRIHEARYLDNLIPQAA
jgi:hypothetical protein